MAAGGRFLADHAGRLSRRVAPLVLALALTACEHGPSVLDPKSSPARRVEGLWWLMFWISVVVFVVVLALMAVSMFRGRRNLTANVDKSEVRWGDPFIAVAGVFIPALVLGGVYLVSLDHMNELAEEGADTTLTIEVIAHDWWWEARYDNGAVTANEIHIPVGQRVRLELTSADVVHSFWVPQLQVKTDHIPGRTTELWIAADEPGRYRGQCAEFCGIQHANMAFFVVAEEPSTFDAWLANEAADAAETAEVEGREIFLDSSCAGCHAVRGTTATATLGPDLTHLAARRTIGAGTLPNTRGHLESFVLNAQEVKPGSAMPPTEISPDELEALLDYLESLE